MDRRAAYDRAIKRLEAFRDSDYDEEFPVEVTIVRDTWNGKPRWLLLESPYIPDIFDP